MKTTAYNTIAFWANRTRPIFPVRELKLTLPLLVLAVILLAFFFTMMHLQVQKAMYGQLIQRQTERVESLRGDVRALNGQLSSATTLPAIRQRAIELGMVEPEIPPSDLLVSLRQGEVEEMGGLNSRMVSELSVRRWAGDVPLVVHWEIRP